MTFVFYKVPFTSPGRWEQSHHIPMYVAISTFCLVYGHTIVTPRVRSECFTVVRISKLFLLLKRHTNLPIHQNTHRKKRMQTQAPTGTAHVCVRAVCPPIRLCGGPLLAPPISARLFVSVVGTHLKWSHHRHEWVGGWCGCRRGWCPSGPVFMCTFPCAHGSYNNGWQYTSVCNPYCSLQVLHIGHPTDHNHEPQTQEVVCHVLTLYTL